MTFSLCFLNRCPQLTSPCSLVAAIPCCHGIVESEVLASQGAGRGRKPESKGAAQSYNCAAFFVAGVYVSPGRGRQTWFVGIRWGYQRERQAIARGLFRTRAILCEFLLGESDGVCLSLSFSPRPWFVSTGFSGIASIGARGVISGCFITWDLNSGRRSVGGSCRMIIPHSDAHCWTPATMPVATVSLSAGAAILNVSRSTFWRFRRKHRIAVLTGRQIATEDVFRGVQEERKAAGESRD